MKEFRNHDHDHHKNDCNCKKNCDCKEKCDCCCVPGVKEGLERLIGRTVFIFADGISITGRLVSVDCDIATLFTTNEFEGTIFNFSLCKISVFAEANANGPAIANSNIKTLGTS